MFNVSGCNNSSTNFWKRVVWSPCMKNISESKILALKYRPRIFKDLIGQELIAETISNAIKIEKIPNAYLLTGIRGVGKTTTARLIAKALNCSKEVSKGSMCSQKDLCDHLERLRIQIILMF